MRTLIFHKSMNPCGGAERVALAFLALLKEKGFEIHLVTSDRTRWDNVCRLFGYDINQVRPEREFILHFRKFSIYRRPIISLFSLIKDHSYDLSISTYFESERGFVDIGYLHAADFLAVTPDKHKYFTNILWKIYYSPYKLFQEDILDRLVLRKPLILTNSKYSKELAAKLLKIKNIIVLYPPVDSSKMANLSLALNYQRENIVVSVGRLDPGRRLELIPEIASKMRSSTRFIIAGSIRDRSSHEFVKKLKHKIDRLGVDVKIFPNLSYYDKVSVLSRAKVYLNPMINETFGIAVVEGMACGCIPVVHRSGAPWKDILKEKNEYGRAFTSTEEAAEHIEEILNMPEDVYNTLSRESRRASLSFDESVFKARLWRIIERFI